MGKLIWLRTCLGSSVAIYAQLAYLRSPHIHTPASRLKHFVKEFDLEMQVFELLRYFGPQENKEKINILGKNRILDMYVSSVQTGTQTPQIQNGARCPTAWFLLPATNG